MSIELSQFHVFCLQQFIGKRALTETGLARQAKCEKAVAKFAIKQLLSAGFLKRLGAYEFAVTSDGELYLKHHNTPMKDGETKTVKPKAEPKSVLKPVELDSLEALELPPSDAEALQALEAMADPDDLIEIDEETLSKLRSKYSSQPDTAKAIEQLEAITGDEDAPDFYGAMAASMGVAAEELREHGKSVPEYVILPAVDTAAAAPIFTGGKLTGVSVGMRIDDFMTNASDEITVQLPPMGNIQIEKATLGVHLDAIADRAKKREMEEKARYAELPALHSADFGTLVRQGLARLNTQLGLKSVQIDEPMLKIEALTKLSDSLKDFDLPLSVLLNDIARDIKNAADRAS